MTRPPDPTMRPLLPEQPGESLAPGVGIAPDGLRLQYSRGGGPGGQNVNKLNTKAQLWIQLGKISGLSAAAIQRLRRPGGASAHGQR